MEPRPFTVQIDDGVIADLKERLARVRWPDEVPGSGWRYGSDLAYMRELVTYWRDEFDWRAQEAKLNTFDQFHVTLDGIDLRFIHQPGVGPEPLPLLLVHGWPGSVREFPRAHPTTDRSGPVRR